MEKKFKPFDKVLVRFNETHKWGGDLYSYFNEEKDKHRCMGFGWADDTQILPYEGNEHLVGTTDEPEEEIQVRYLEWIMVSSLGKPSDVPSEWYLEQIYDIWEEDIETKRGYTYSHFIRFSDFNPSDMEATKSKILCVKNGKIVRYRE